eukprot:TRINITY_DN2923_c0_g1_i1.p1 TRINITY_DN2923_c0_g1~~TRINITY_DN2923_c0_g1_i1.p1  ORF type:complete len:508 (+),score=159.63 TRINITY_DN2923_c0_g1_i1:35-1525(+)
MMQRMEVEDEIEDLSEYQEEQESLPEGWCMRRHVTGLPFYLHTESGIIVWTKPYTRKQREKEHTPPLAAFSAIIKFHDRELKQALEKLDGAKKKQQRGKSKGSAIQKKLLTPKQEPNESREEGELKEEGELVDDGPVKRDLDVDAFTNSLPEPMETNARKDIPKATSTDDDGENGQWKKITIPKEVERIQSALIILVAGLVMLEKRRKKRSYEEYLAEDDEGFRNRRKKTGPTELNPEGKTPISFLQEYCVNVLKTTPEYRVSIQEDPTKPFCTVVIINNTEYGRGAFLNKKQSKQMAAEQTLEMLCPGVFPKTKPFDEEEKTRELVDDHRDLAIDDERILLLEQHKTPAQILQEYCTRYHTSVDYEFILVDDDDDEPQTDKRFKIIGTVDKLTGVGYGKNKREAKQRAAQLLLKQLHPNIESWAILLDMYSLKVRDDDRDKRPQGPNFHLLEKLKEEMKKNFEDPKPSDEELANATWEHRDGGQLNTVAKRQKIA